MIILEKKLFFLLTISNFFIKKKAKDNIFKTCKDWHLRKPEQHELLLATIASHKYLIFNQPVSPFLLDPK